MVESESFIKEVSEEVKRDILFKTLKKFKWPIIALIILLVGAVGGYEYYKFDKKVKAQEIGELFVSAIENLKNNGQIFSNLDDSMEEDAKQIEIDQLKQKLEHQEKTMEDYTQTLEKLSKDNLCTE